MVAVLEAPSKGRSLWRRIVASVKRFNRSRIDYARLAWPVEWAIFKKGAWWGILFFIITLLIHNWVHNCVYMLAGQYGVYGPYGRPGNPVVDLLFELFGPGPVDWTPAPGDVILYCTIVMGVLYALRPLLFPFPFRTMNILWRWAVVASLATYARLASFIFTILPGPAEHCSEANFNPPTTAGEVFKRIFVSGGCSDLIFSGHMLYVISVTCALFRYSCNKYLKIFVLLLTILQAFLIVASRSHYSVDVVPNDFRTVGKSISSPGVSDDDEEYPRTVPSSGTAKSGKPRKISSVSTRTSPDWVHEFRRTVYN
ncbi:conserved hypothetical protein [Perkinsus marinus ATCC 50983]|uniref:Sphingomyelin synthase-like domain-containing protein n=1 Tax=Perkinsus marinus (strain ATCC 50983 / TXsc) TaxID=423536 RepID=C5LAC8_PERM5|nr:conserved hypothetical protein [Perkinsus marinus ATCC 50983]EER06384.1 conserved hypothetical protein [Perkinsus marinus ATCC 50983]|eukprot:XP_002774568.1 conserved hypothetical protein [Perkinsus marinus ATCC 50983]